MRFYTLGYCANICHWRHFVEDARDTQLLIMLHNLAYLATNVNISECLIRCRQGLRPIYYYLPQPPPPPNHHHHHYDLTEHNNIDGGAVRAVFVGDCDGVFPGVFPHAIRTRHRGLLWHVRDADGVADLKGVNLLFLQDNQEWTQARVISLHSVSTATGSL